jgi:hypothetical protein
MQRCKDAKMQRGKGLEIRMELVGVGVGVGVAVGVAVGVVVGVAVGVGVGVGVGVCRCV